ncbi:MULTISPECIES: alpha-amylase family glycosyl hydrolase [Dyella]|nr:MULTISPECIES: alpha-amylase family glycosyl hydrolase [Dyella]
MFWKKSALAAVLATLMALPLHAAPSEAPPSQGSGVWYEIFVRAWYDTNGDGIGDLNGVTAKLDYLQSLGVSGIWLMPINPSPSYHGYDITDYRDILPQYGTMGDFERLVQEAHKRNIQIIMDLVINHTSDQHPWFVSALDPKSPYRHWYTWAGPATDINAPAAAGDRAWHAKNGQYYLSGFTGAMPDLNFDEPAVRHEMVDVGQFWLRKGVDGFRLDAARHIYDDLKSDTGKPETVRKNVVWWTEFRQGMQRVRPDVYLVGEVMQPSMSDLAPYLKPLGSVFNFPVAAQLIKSAGSEKVDGLDTLLSDTYRSYAQAAGDAFVDSPFLSNHDQDRVLSQLGGNLDHMRVAAALLMTLPGRPFVYYGEEIGMLGKKPDANVREPMRWSREPGVEGESRWKASSVKQGGEVSVQAEEANAASLLATYRTLIHWRIEQPLLRDGEFRAVESGNARVLTFERAEGARSVLVAHNLSGKAQTIKIGKAHASMQLHVGGNASLANGALTLPPYTSVVIQ